jgi:hypothetical protein
MSALSEVVDSEASNDPGEVDDTQTPEQRLDWLRQRGVEIETIEERTHNKATGKSRIFILETWGIHDDSSTAEIWSYERCGVTLNEHRIAWHTPFSKLQLIIAFVAFVVQARDELTLSGTSACSMHCVNVPVHRFQ